MKRNSVVSLREPKNVYTTFSCDNLTISQLKPRNNSAKKNVPSLPNDTNFSTVIRNKCDVNKNRKNIKREIITSCQISETTGGGKSDMEITQADLRIADYAIEFSNAPSSGNKNKEESWIIHEPIIDNEDIKEESSQSSLSSENSFFSNDLEIPEPNLNSIQHESSASSGNILTKSDYLSSLDDGEHCNEDLSERLVSQEPEILIKNDDDTENIYNIQTVVVPSDVLELSLGIKQEREDCNCDLSIDGERETSCEKLSIVIENQKRSRSSSITRIKEAKEKNSIRGTPRQRLRKKAECMREKRKKLYESESLEERNERLAKEAAKRRELRMFYETPEKRRKRLDSEAARKREHRMYNETPDERRKRLDREAERRRLKRLNMYENETPEERRERLIRESTKRRESRKNQYANETDEERQLRLEKDAMRAREMRFTRSAIESDEERRERLIKDALRKRELRMHSGDDRVTRNNSGLGAPRNFEQLNNAQMKEQLHDNPFEGHYLGNWMMWFQNTISPSDHKSDDSTESQTEA